ncbi:MAG: creatinine amidohydrolase [Trebonia sp.]|nr:creatinine amidohydrolase [Trebonia sp.]
MTIWSDTASPDLAAAAARTDRGHEVGLVPVGAIEQHGPHLPVGTDTIVASALCAAAGAAADALVLPAISLGVSYGHGTVLAGTLSLTPDLLVATVHQYVRWASVTGLRRLLFVNAHMGNSASLSVATDSVRLLAPQLRVGTIDWWAADPAVFAEITADGDDIHANRAETAMMMAIAPQLVHSQRASGADDPDRTAGLTFRYTAPALSRNGVTGRPSEASADLGAELQRRVVSALAGRIERGRVEEPPLGVAAAPGFPF